MIRLVTILLICFQGILGIIANDVSYCIKDEKIEFEYGSTVRIKSDDYERSPDITRCMVKVNNNLYELYPKNNMTSSHSPVSASVNANICEVVIENFPFDYGGKWAFHVSTSRAPGSDQALGTKNLSFCKIIVKETRRMLPTKAVIVPNNTDIKLFLDDVFDEMTDCILIKNFDKDYYPSKIYNLTRNESSVDGVERYGKCGFTMKVTSLMSDNWELRSCIGEYKVKKATFYIRIREPILMNFQKYQNVVWLRGSEANISVSFDSEVNKILNPFYCEWIQPDGQIVYTNQPNCNYEVETVTKTHAGVWKCRFKVSDRIDFEEAEVEVTVKDPLKSIETSVQVTSSSITLICRTQFCNSNFCVFTMPNGTTINFSQGVITSKYEYYGRGYSDSDRCRYGSFGEKELAAPLYSECGLKINNPTLEDNGGWKCTMGWRDDNRPLSSFIMVNSNSTDALNVSATDKIYVKRGNDFKMKCSVNAKLSYCGFQGPDKTVYQVTAKENSSLDNSLKYIGSSLNNGECEVLVKASGGRHNGEWKCKLGIEHLGKVLEKKIEVKVRDYDLITDSRVIRNNQTNYIDTIVLSCRLGSEVNDKIKYCRWTYDVPRFSFFVEESDNTYSTFFHSTSCHLRIKTDLRQWHSSSYRCMCYATLSINSDEEIFALIYI